MTDSHGSVPGARLGRGNIQDPIVIITPDWAGQAACLGDGEDPAEPVSVLGYVARNCVRCPVLQQCGDVARSGPWPHGVWGAEVFHGNSLARHSKYRQMIDRARAACDHDPRRHRIVTRLTNPAKESTRQTWVECQQCTADALAAIRAYRNANAAVNAVIRGGKK